MMNKLIDFFLSLKLTVVLLVLSMILVFAGTLAQVDQGIWTVMDQYFRCLIARIDLHVFFPRSMDIPDVWIPFPGGFLIGWLLVINLITVHWANFRIQVGGGRKIAGILFLLLGVLVTVGVMFGWGTASVAATAAISSRNCRTLPFFRAKLSRIKPMRTSGVFSAVFFVLL